MARGAQLQSLVSYLRAEAGLSQKVSVGTDQEDKLKHLLRRTQETLYDAHDWTFLQHFFSKALSAGQRYYDMPSGLADTRIVEAAIDDGSEEPRPVDYGIGFAEYATYNSDEDERADPVERWDFRRTSATATQIEVWPIPASSNQTLRFKGIRSLPALTANTDTAALDDHLIVLFAAAEIMASQENKGASLKLQLATDRLNVLKGLHAGPVKPFQMGGGNDMAPRRGVVIRVTS